MIPITAAEYTGVHGSNLSTFNKLEFPQKYASEIKKMYFNQRYSFSDTPKALTEPTHFPYHPHT